ncbi:4289_t:CDS:2, partial [Cetraspora pellucida]
MKKAQPNILHYVLSKLQLNNYIQQIITQNVDGLYQKFNSKKIILELHGSLNQIHCLNCGHINQRSDYQIILNLPYGTSYDSFNYSSCVQCSIGIYKSSVAKSVDLVKNCKCILVVGSSLTTYFAFGIVKLASDLYKDIAIINLGETRDDFFGADGVLCLEETQNNKKGLLSVGLIGKSMLSISVLLNTVACGSSFKWENKYDPLGRLIFIKKLLINLQVNIKVNK